MSTNNGKAPAVIPNGLLAKQIGLEEYLLLKQIAVITKHNEDNQYCYSDGEYWACISFNDLLNDYFPFWSMSTLKRTMSSLREQRLIITREDRPDPKDRTNWYRVNNARLNELIEPFLPKAATGSANTSAVTSPATTLRPMTLDEKMCYDKEYEHKRIIIGINADKLNLTPNDRRKYIDKEITKLEKELDKKYEDLRRK